MGYIYLCKSVLSSVLLLYTSEFSLFSAVAETEFTEENQNGFWAYLKLQKRSFLILLFTRFTLRLSRIEWHDTYEYARSHKNWEQSAAYAVSTIAFSLLCFLIYKKGNYNKPMVALSITACLWNVWRVVYILLMMNSASTILREYLLLKWL